ncbi:DUF3099 domain-containing protein [Rothia sp. CCM 9417]|uniref:DUF3099 domain-containing protein n=1 Tax=Rothia sp. CCM 9417 TaxID=3402657 RepID=UPI003AE491D2
MAAKYWTAEDLKAAGYASGDSEVFEITGAAERQSTGVSARAKSYAFKMFLRIIFIIAAVMVEGVWQWIFLAGAAIIPWLAVVVANGEHQQGGSSFTAYLPAEQQAAIAAAQEERISRQDQAEHDWQPGEEAVSTDGPIVIDGELVEDEHNDGGSSSGRQGGL